ncbi:fatty acid desaturase family protein [Winogradskyella bathintestinalis]|uniref:Acyl-CoA desaturase n=1 Tax=Winogradskyella bathintestinalis TaxID=3035208 RepID=A0ABT7ZVB5_9FLAO|nr:acyl-CoA desaturase [Winogradskyella bathintestinalis]MDN3492950.1 acyl-CoA desaturase [Winogradskyella bathintestinalis]
MAQQTVKFSRNDSAKFFRTLNKRVNNYFKENNIKKTGNWKLYVKAIIMFTLLLGPLVLLLTVDNLPGWLLIISMMVIGIGMAGVGMNVMHDANHGSFSSKKWVNKLMGSSIHILAGNDYNWKVQHNVLHHTYTNIQGHDEDIDAGRIIRFSKHSQWLKIHKYQRFYAFLLYGLLTVNWAVTTDFKQTYQYLKRKLSYGDFPNPATQWTKLIIGKIIYYSIWVVLPLVLGYAWWQVLIGFLIMHYTAGIILSVIFQLAHVMPNTEMPLPDQNGTMKNTWAIHQLFTTSNFSPKSWIVEFYTGGLNRQVEHHLFSNISHVHYKHIAQIVRETAHEFSLPYNEYNSIWTAIAEHYQQLKQLGMKPNMA